jgi:hypothetical protein
MLRCTGTTAITRAIERASEPFPTISRRFPSSPVESQRER